ncbi:MAG TPA: HEAT repeat domain-containing protein [Candidatus Rifleibacterium sp.]|nr:HEAT repeat domain-containing protein [Candidatus Rifleibacterium sp.]HPT44293.1 HEAT repeat domain-containing protein [Candidatus Rifleibacterium sp.]
MSRIDSTKLRRELVSEKSEVRKAAIAELKSFSAEEALPLLTELLNCKNDDVLTDIGKSMAAYKDEALPYLIKALSSESYNQRRGASIALARLGPTSLNKLMAMIPENEEDVDYWMVQTLGNMGGEAVQYLVRIFRHPNQKIRIAAIRAAQNINDPRMVVSLLHLLEEQNWPIRKAAYDSLEKIYTCNQQAVASALESSSEEAKFWIIKLLSQQAAPQLVPQFARIVESAPMESKLEAIKALAMVENAEAHRLLVGYLAHKSWIIRKTAADAIWAQGLGVSEELMSAIKGANVDARYWSVKLLGQSREPQIFEEIVKCLQDSQHSVRSAACQALGSLGDKRALAPLMTMLNDESEEVRTAAILSLSQLGDREEIQPKSALPAHIRKENMLPCTKCGKLVGRNFSFCPFCMTHLRNSCRHCGRVVEAGWKGCPDCGAPV